MKQCQLLFVLLLVFSGRSFSQEKNNAKLFKTSKVSLVVKSDSIDLDQYKDFIIIPHGKMFNNYIDKIGYFKEAMNYKDLVKKVKAEESGASNSTLYRDYYTNKKDFLTLFLYMLPDNVIELSLVKLDTGAVFTVRNKSTTDLIGITAGTTTVKPDTWDSMMNELFNYIRANSKTYKL